jgi:hypothetical protein
MSLLDKFNELEYLLLARRDALALPGGTPFVLLIYDPYEERLCQARRQELAERLESRGQRVHEIGLGTFIFDYYRQKGQLERLFALERERPQELRRMIASIYRPELVKRIVAEAGDMEDDAIIFLHEVGSLYPFVRVCNLLGDLENRVKQPLVVFYPGSEQDGRLLFLNLEEEGHCHARKIHSDCQELS